MKSEKRINKDKQIKKKYIKNRNIRNNRRSDCKSIDLSLHSKRFKQYERKRNTRTTKKGKS